MDTPSTTLPFATLLRRSRLAAGLTQEELAERARLSVRGITDLERGERRAPRKETVQLLADALALGPDARAAFERAARRQAIADPDTRPHPPTRDPGAGHTNLPLLLTSFVGRAQEQDAVRRLLADHRLVTLTGAGGCGKTRLLLQVAGTLLDAYPDGVWLVELAALGDPALIPQAVASVLGVRDQPDRPLSARLAEYLRPKHLLLALDNCEHLVAACAELADALLRVCPALTILASSREAIGVGGERAYKVPSLSLPEPSAAHTLQQARASEAVQLFMQRGESARTGFAVTEPQVVLVEQVCRRLDGIPLALELAAARLETLSLEQLAVRLDDRFRLLTGGSRTALPRQQTLRATLDWSYDLLSEHERALLRRLSVFAGGWTLEAAETVCGGEGIAEDDVLDLLTALVRRSLVMVDEDRTGGRYRLLETVRQYGHERLVAAGEAEAYRDRHLAWYAAFAEPAFDGRGHYADQAVLVAHMAVEQENLLTALAWSGGGRGGWHIEQGLRVAAGAGLLWYLHGFASEGQVWLERLLAGSGDAAPEVRARALHTWGFLAWAQGDYARSAVLMESAQALHAQVGDALTAADAHVWHGIQLIYLGNYEQATPLLHEALEASRRIGSIGIEGLALLGMGVIAHLRGDLERAEALYGQSLSHKRKLGDLLAVTNLLANLANVARDRGAFDEAVRLHRESLLVRIDLHDLPGFAECFEGLAVAAAGFGQHERAAILFGAAEALREAIARPIELADRIAHQVTVPAVAAVLGEEAFAAAWAEGRAMPLEAALTLALEEPIRIDR